MLPIRLRKTTYHHFISLNFKRVLGTTITVDAINSPRLANRATDLIFIPEHQWLPDNFLLSFFIFHHQVSLPSILRLVHLRQSQVTSYLCHIQSQNESPSIKATLKSASQWVPARQKFLDTKQGTYSLSLFFLFHVLEGHKLLDVCCYAMRPKKSSTPKQFKSLPMARRPNCDSDM